MAVVGTVGTAVSVAGIIIAVGGGIKSIAESVTLLKEQSKHLSELIEGVIKPMILVKQKLESGTATTCTYVVKMLESGGLSERVQATDQHDGRGVDHVHPVLRLLENLKDRVKEAEKLIKEVKQMGRISALFKRKQYIRRIEYLSGQIGILVPALCTCYQELLHDQFTDKMKSEIEKLSKWEEKWTHIKADIEDLKSLAQRTREEQMDMHTNIVNYFEEIKEQQHRPNVPKNLKIPYGELEVLDSANPLDGSFGPVFKARHKRQQVIIAKQFDDSSLTAKQEIEGQVHNWYALRHSDFIVQLYGYTENNDGQYLLILQYMENGSLREVLKDKAKHELDWDTRKHMAYNCAEGLWAVHFGQQRPMLHRAVTSAKFLVDKYYNVKITDNGHVKARSQISRSRSKTREESEEEMDYACPEKVQNPQYRPTLKSEIYRFGIVLYEIASRMMPFEGIQTDEAVDGMFKFKYVQQGKTEAPPTDTPTEFKDLMDRCRRFKAEDRPDTGVVVKELRKMCYPDDE